MNTIRTVAVLASLAMAQAAAAADDRLDDYFALDDIEILWAKSAANGLTVHAPDGSAGGTRADTQPQLAVGDKVTLQFRFLASFGAIARQAEIDKRREALRRDILDLAWRINPVEGETDRGRTAYEWHFPRDPTDPDATNQSIELPVGSDLRRLDDGIVTLPGGKVLRNVELRDLYLAAGAVFNTNTGFVVALDPDFIDPKTGDLVADPGILYVCAVVLDSAGEIIPAIPPSEAAWSAWSKKNCKRRVILDPAAQVQDIAAIARLTARRPTGGPVRIGIRAAIFGHNTLERAGTLQRVLLESKTSVVEIVAGAVTNLAIVNGGFERPVTPESGFYVVYEGSQEIDGWVVGSGSVDRIDSYWRAAEGRYSIDLDGSAIGSLYQDIPGLTVGQSYTVSFQLSGNPECYPEVKSLTVSAGDKSENYEVSTAGQSAETMRWTGREFHFTASDETVRLTFQSMTGGQYCGPVIDDVQISLAQGQ